jgi:hypothetical protein
LRNRVKPNAIRLTRLIGLLAASVGAVQMTW